MRKLTSASRTTTPRASHGRLARLLLALAALLLCGAALAQAQERRHEGGDGVLQPTVNVKPFEEVALLGKQLVEQGKLGPDTTINVSATAERMEDGRLRPESVKVQWHTAPDETVTTLAHKLLTALSESRVLGALEDAKSVRLGLKLDRQNVSVLVAGEMPTEIEASRYVEGYKMFLRLGVMAKRGTDEGRLYERLGFSSEGKMFKMSFEMPRDEAARMIADMLAKKAAKAASQQD
ncbi:MAG TPA: hypothetical protein VF588_03360 [Pyrinomonadaceae bacterium]